MDRDAAVKSVCDIIASMPRARCEDHALPMLCRLADGEWFSSRVAACGLIAAVHTHLATQDSSDAATEKQVREDRPLLFFSMCMCGDPIQ